MLTPYSPERLADRAEIQDVMHLWTRAIDRLDYDGIRRVYHPDAIDSHGDEHFAGGVEQLIEWIQSRHNTIPFALHALNNMLIEFTGPDSAIVETVVTVTQPYPKEGDPVVKLSGGGKDGVSLIMIALARYVDQFERKNDEWRIQHRQVVMDSQMILESGPGSLADGIVLGRRDQDDYIYKLRRKAGLQ